MAGDTLAVRGPGASIPKAQEPRKENPLTGIYTPSGLSNKRRWVRKIECVFATVLFPVQYYTNRDEQFSFCMLRIRVKKCVQ